MASRSHTATKLREYRGKRNFAVSPEPAGGKRAKPAARRKTKRPLYCVQKHLARNLHYDLRLEHNGVLLSWAVPKGPSLNPSEKRLAMRVEDHPQEYGDFEGVIPEGYGAGIVLLWDKGSWEPQTDDVDAALEKGELKFRLNGVKLKGSWVLVRTRRYGSDGQSRSWLLIKHRDEWAGEIDVTELFPQSVKSHGDFAEILAADQPAVWESHKPGGGAIGKTLQKIIEQATQIRAQRKPKSRPRRKSNV